VNGNKVPQLLRWSLALVAIVSIAAAPAKPPVKPPVKPKAVNLAGRLLGKSELATIKGGDLPPTEWTEPPVLRPDEKTRELHAALDIRYADNVIRIGETGQPVRLRSYNNMLTGPTFRVKAGDKLFIHLSNDLPVEPKMMEMKSGECMIPMHGFNVTNLHTHGLHISPSGNSDNVMLSIPPGGGKESQMDYQFDILGPKDGDKARQYPGTFWYHAHNHGSTSMQLASGMAGALIVEDGPADEVPEVKAAQERLFLLQQLAYKVNPQTGIGEAEVFTELGSNWANNGKRTAVNGRVKPLIKMRPGQVERWRFIDSGIFAGVPLVIRPAQAGDNFKMYRIALDGITRPKPEETTNIELAPGYRVDLLAAAPAQKGTYYLYKQQSTLFSVPGVDGTEPGVDEAQIVAQIEVAGEPCTGTPGSCANKIPAALKPPTDMLPDIKVGEINRPLVTVAFGLTDDKKFFTVNHSCYQDAVMPDLDKTVGDIERWTVLNYTDSPHPFHIHVNAFQLIDEQGNPGPWRDTILVPPRTKIAPDKYLPGKIEFRTRFERFDGTFVLHCHILLHEDEGMMQKVRVKPKK